MALKKVVSIVPVSNVFDKVAEYDNLRAQAKIIEERMKTLSNEIKDHAEIEGVKDSTGSFNCENDQYIFSKVARKSMSLKTEETMAFLKENKLTSAIVTKKIVSTTIDEKEIERFIIEGTMTQEQLEELTDIKVTYALSLKKKDEMPVVEQTTVALVASKKPKSKLGGNKK